MKYIFTDNRRTINEFEDLNSLYEIFDNNISILEDEYKEYLDVSTEPVRIFEMEYETSRAFKLIDPIAYRCGLADFINNEAEEAKRELEMGYDYIGGCYSVEIEE